MDKAALAALGVTATDGTTIEGDVRFEGLNELRCPYIQGYAEIGLVSYVGYHAFIGAGTIIGRYCSIAMNSTVGAGEHPTAWLTSHNFAFGHPNLDGGLRARYGSDQKLTIGHDVWIGANAFVSTNITIGSGAIIGAGAVVVKDVPPYAIVIGNPARILRMRFADEIIERLLASQWWQLPTDHVRELPFHDIERCLDILDGLAS